MRLKKEDILKPDVEIKVRKLSVGEIDEAIQKAKKKGKGKSIRFPYW